MPAGRLRDRVRFESRSVGNDGAGNTNVGDWAKRFVRSAEIVPLKGGEDVIAARLQGTQPALIRVRFDPETSAVTPDWRAVDERTGVVYAIHTAADMERRRTWWTMMCEAGVAP